MRHSSARRAAAWLALVMTLACDGTGPARDDPPQVSPQVGPPAEVRILGGDGQTGPAGSPLPDSLVALVVDRSGKPVPNVAATWGVGVYPSPTRSDAAGIIRGQWLLGRILGTQTAALRVADLEPTTFTATSVPFAYISLVSGGGQSAAVGTALAQPIVVSVTDHLGRPIVGLPLAFVPLEGSANPWGATSDADGRAQFVWTLGPNVGAQSMRVGVFKSSAYPPYDPLDVTATGLAR